MLSVIWRLNRAGSVSMLALAALLAGSSTPAFAQATLDESRLRKVEAEIRALQRKVFPGGDERFFTPEISSDTAPAQVATQPSTTAVTDILTRMDAIESQLSSLTGQIEENSNRITQIEEKALQAQTPADELPAEVSEYEEVQPDPVSASQTNLDAMTGGASAAKVAVKPAATEPVELAEVAPAPLNRVEAVQAIVKPQTDDPADDEYSYGYRLWNAKFFPEARQQLQIFADKYPDHWRASWGRNLLGRSYYDDGKPREAAKWFLQNYQADKAGGRAPDSLLYLAASMKKLNDTKRACIALAEFGETYALESAGRLEGLYNATRDGLTCSG